MPEEMPQEMSQEMSQEMPQEMPREMSQVRTNALLLTAPPGTNVLGGEALARVLPHIADRTVIEQAWLGEREAWRALFVASAGDDDLAALRGRIAGVLAPHPIDVNVLPDDLEHRQKKLLVADMESTIIEQECLDELADYMGLRPTISAITERAMRGELDFQAALNERVGLLKGLDAKVLDDLCSRITLMPGAATLVKTMHRRGALCALVSGGFSYFSERVATRLGFDIQQANTLMITAGKLAGRVAEPILGREAKLATLQRLTRELKIAPAQTLAVGDGANDLDMIKAAGLGVAFRAKPVVAAAAKAAITHGDLTALLYLQGCTRAEFAV
jgi:phosphoserine phosphatase